MVKRSQPTSIQTVGGSLVYRQTLFCESVGLVACCHGKDIQLLNASTGNLVRRLVGHGDRVTGLAYGAEANRYQLVSSALDGEIKTWDLQDGGCLETVAAPGPVLALALGNPSNETEEGGKVLYLAINAKGEGPKTSNGGWSYGRYVASGTGKARKLNRTHEIVSEEKTKGCAFHGCAVSKSPSSGTRTAVISQRTISVWFESRPGTTFELQHNIVLTAVTWNPIEDVLTTGDSAGQLVSWDLGSKWRKSSPQSTPVTSLLHWHSHGVGAVEYNLDGNYLLSGGEEAVLVIWQVRSGKRTFLPRLGAPIAQISRSGLVGNEFVVGLLDNSLSLFNMTSMDQTWRHRGLQLAAHHMRIGGMKRLRALPRDGIVFEPRNGNLVIQGLAGTLQFYDVEEEQHKFSVNVTERQTVQRTDGETLQPTVVELVCFNYNGTKMTTGERRTVIRNPNTREIIYHEKLALRFWEWRAEIGGFELTTYVDSPHKAAMTSLLYHPTSDLVVSCSRDNTFKVWHQVNSTVNSDMTNNRTSTAQSTWACRSIGFYRGLPISSAAISADGSLLAVGYDQVVTLWDPWTNEMRAGLTHTSHPVPIEISDGNELASGVLSDEQVECSHVKQICFLSADVPFLVTRTVHGLYVWNLLSCTLSWSLRLDSIGFICAAPSDSGRFIATTESNSGSGAILSFHYSTSTPVAIAANTDTTLVAVQFGGRLQKRLYGVDNHRRLVKVGDVGEFDGAEVDEEMELLAVETESNKPVSKVSSLFGNNTASVEESLRPAAAGILDEDDNLQAPTRGRSGSIAREELFSSYPSHLLPPTSVLFEELLGGKEVTQTQGDVEMNEELPAELQNAVGWLKGSEPVAKSHSVRARSSSVASVSQLTSHDTTEPSSNASSNHSEVMHESFEVPSQTNETDVKLTRAFASLFVSSGKAQHQEADSGKAKMNGVSTPVTTKKASSKRATTAKKKKTKSPKGVATPRRTREKA